MADYYLEFSETISELTQQEATWLTDQLWCVVVIGDTEYPADQIPDEVDADQVTWLGPRFLRGSAGYEESPEEPDFCYELREDKAAGGSSRYLWLYSEDHADLNQVALLVQKFLRTFRPPEMWAMTYATTCSKSRWGAFGGGALIVTANEITWHDAQVIADKARQQAVPPLSSPC